MDAASKTKWWKYSFLRWCELDFLTYEKPIRFTPESFPINEIKPEKRKKGQQVL